MVAPGRLLSLGAATDLADAQRVWRYVEVLRDEDDGTLRGRLLTEVIWFKWEKPRIPQPRLATKYSFTYPWSADARRRLSDGGSGGLVIEHVYPKQFLKADVLAAGSAAEICALLSERVLHAVIAKTDEWRLMRAGNSWNDFAADPWIRYRAAWPQLDGFQVPKGPAS